MDAERAPLDWVGAVALVRAARLYFELGRHDMGFLLLARANAGDEELRACWPQLRAQLEELLASPTRSVQAATTIGKIAPIDEVERVLKDTRPRASTLGTARDLLALWLRRRDRERARAVAQDEPSSSVVEKLTARGEMLF